MITTNLVFSEWERIFKNPMTTMAAIDRLVHHSVILDMMHVESYRAKAASQQHLSSDRPKKPSSKQTTLVEATTSLRDSDASSTTPSQGSCGSTSKPVPTAVLLAEDTAESSRLEAPNRQV